MRAQSTKNEMMEWPYRLVYCCPAQSHSSFIINHSSSFCNLPYAPPPPPPPPSLPSPLVRWTMLDIHPPRPSPFDDVSRFPFSSCPGGSMSRPGMALSAVKLLERRISSEGTGDRMSSIRLSTSASWAGVGMAVVASPKRASMSSRRILAVSG